MFNILLITIAALGLACIAWEYWNDVVMVSLNKSPSSYPFRMSENTMNRLQQIILGLEIVNRYHGDIYTEHDMVYICCDTEPTVEELTQLEEAGWRPGNDMNSWEHFV